MRQLTKVQIIVTCWKPSVPLSDTRTLGNLNTSEAEEGEEEEAAPPASRGRRSSDQPHPCCLQSS